MIDWKVTAWSHSRYALYDLCPAKYKYKNIDKLKEPTPEAFKRGRKVHTEAEQYLNKNIDELPKSLETFRNLMASLRDMPDKIIEKQWGFTSKWKPTGWFSKDTWYRSVLDAAVVYPDDTADIIDHKTGKKYGSNKDQMELFAISMMSFVPSLKFVTTRLWYLDSGEEDIAEFNNLDVEKLKDKWVKKVQPLFNDTIFAPKPNDKCRFCHWRLSNDGPCRFG